MGYDYDKLYESTPDALGDPTQRIVDFFAKNAPPPKTVLDIGCGQGRDALFLGRLGYDVTGIDLSPHGIADLNAAATREGLQVRGEVADITTYHPLTQFDVVLIDRTLHMLSEEPRHTCLKTLLDVATEWVVIVDERSNIAGFKRVIADHPAVWDAVYEKAGDIFLRRQPETGD